MTYNPQQTCSVRRLRLATPPGETNLLYSLLAILPRQLYIVLIAIDGDLISLQMIMPLQWNFMDRVNIEANRRMDGIEI
jgi:hypothetical protein